MLNDDIIKERQEQMKNEPTIHAWSTTTCACFGGEANRRQKRFGAFIVPTSLSFFIFVFYTNIYVFLGALALSIIGYFVVYYLGFAESYFEYRLTKIGIEEISIREMLPDATYSVIRGFAWFGVAVCVFTVVLIGPLAFVGAGAFALMSFKFTGLKQQKDVTQYVFDEKMIVGNIKNNNCIYIMPNPLTWFFGATLYFDYPERDEILSQLRNILPNADYIEGATEEEVYDHPICDNAFKNKRIGSNLDFTH